MRVLLTSFSAFGGLPHNPSQRVMELVADLVAGASVDKLVLPVETSTVGQVLGPAYEMGYDLVIHTGVALDRSCITIERIALNLLDFDADEAMERRVDTAIEDGAPLALPARLPVRKIVEAWQSARIEGRSSTSAGTFLCNQVMYTSLRSLPEATRVGFLHVAPDEQLGAVHGRPSQPAATQARAVEIAIATSLGLAQPRVARS